MESNKNIENQNLEEAPGIFEYFNDKNSNPNKINLINKNISSDNQSNITNNFTTYPSSTSNINNIHEPNTNKNKNLQYILQNQKNLMYYPFQMNSLTNQMYQYQMNYINYYNKLNQIIPNNNNYNKYSLKIDISSQEFKKLSKRALFLMIQFLQKYCKIETYTDISNYKHPFFTIEKSKNIINEYLLKFKKNENSNKKAFKEHFENIIGDENETIKEDNNDSNEKKEIKNNLGNEKIIDNNLLFKNNKWICKNHNREFKTFDAYISHFKSTHKYFCQFCGEYFGFLKKFNKHQINCNKNKIINNMDINLDINKNKKYKNCINNENKNNDNSSSSYLNNMIKCSDCDLIFHNFESMTLHFFQIHEKKTRENSKKVENNNSLKINNNNNLKKIEDRNEENQLNKNKQGSNEIQLKKKKEEIKSNEEKKMKEQMPKIENSKNPLKLKEYKDSRKLKGLGTKEDLNKQEMKIKIGEKIE